MKQVLAPALATLVVLAGCETMSNTWSNLTGGGPKATATLEPTKGSNVRGKVDFEQRGDKVRVVASISGLRPNGEFGFHIHEAGDCSSGDGMSAKGHFNPFGKPPGPASIVGRGLIVHVQPDDYKTQPTGNAGARSACAVIKRV